MRCPHVLQAVGWLSCGWRALPLIALLMAMQLAAFAGHLSTDTFVTGIAEPRWFWLELVGRLASPAWLGLEALAYSRQLRLRIALGLADPLVANRFLLWSMASATGMMFLLTSVPPLSMEPGPALVNADLVAFAVFGVATALIYWPAFFPPAAYRRYIVGSAA